MENYKDQLQEDYLMHFGVPGMKWGRRKARETGGNGNRMSRRERKALNKQIINEHANNLRVRKLQYDHKLATGKMKGTERHYTEQALRDTVKKYGKSNVMEARKAQKRQATKGALMSAGMATTALVLYGAATARSLKR